MTILRFASILGLWIFNDVMFYLIGKQDTQIKLLKWMRKNLTEEVTFGDFIDGLLKQL